MSLTTEKICLCALNRIFGFEPKIAIALLAHFGSATEIFAAGTQAIDAILGPYSKYKGALCRRTLDEAGSELAALSKSGTVFIGITEKGYPALLKECDDPPVGLYVRSSSRIEDIFGQSQYISVVGTRNITPYGRYWCTKTVNDLASVAKAPVIVSGLAFGTDICAHRTAIEKGLPTIGVMATGPETIYPARHHDFALRLCSSPGSALVTDYPPGTAPLAINFLRRNRIIAGLSRATVLIESRIKGGGMMTSRLAFSYGREVYALPGRADDEASKGCNLLIKDKIAEPLISTEYLLESLGMGQRHRYSRNRGHDVIERIYSDTPLQDKIGRMAEILASIRKERGITIEELTYRTGLDYSIVSQLTGIMETDGLITIDLMQRCSINAGQL